MDRRHFLKAAVAAGLLAAPAVRAGAAFSGAEAAAEPLRLLVLGGTGFTGPFQVAYAVARGHAVTVFNRGRTNPGILPDGVEQLTGDRSTGELDALKGREWDVVIDIPATLPRWVRDTAGLLRGSADRYVHISSLSAYADTSVPGTDESAPVAVLEDPDTEDMRHFGALKAAAEQEAREVFPGRTLVIRPGLIVGPGDQSDRFTYWPARIARGGEVMAPGDPADPVQIIDARDLAEWVIRLVEQGATGDFNAVGPAERMGVGAMLTGIRDAIGATDARLTWVDSTFLSAQGVQPWSHMPVWVPPVGPFAGFSQASNRKALAHGLTFRSLADTARATLGWHLSRPAERQAALRAGLTPDREAEVLAAWHARGD